MVCAALPWCRSCCFTPVCRGLRYLSHADAIGSVLPADALLGDKLTYRDRDHWSLYGAQIFGARLVAALQTQGYADVFVPR